MSDNRESPENSTPTPELPEGIKRVPLKAFRPLLEVLQPLSDVEANNLRGYMKSLLHHQHATAMALERFYCFAAAAESIAFGRSYETGERARKVIYRIITDHNGDNDLHPCGVPTRGPRPDDSSESAAARP